MKNFKLLKLNLQNAAFYLQDSYIFMLPLEWQMPSKSIRIGLIRAERNVSADGTIHKKQED